MVGRALPPLEERLAGPGILVQAVVRPHVSGVLRIAMHDGLETRTSEAHTLFIRGEQAITLWCAYYGPEVLRNPWQPFDQPSSAAYMPLSYDAFVQVDVGRNARFLVQKQPRIQPLNGNVIAERSSRIVLAIPVASASDLQIGLKQILLTIGVPLDALTRCLEAILVHWPELRY